MRYFGYVGSIDWSFLTVIKNYLIVGTFALLSDLFVVVRYGSLRSNIRIILHYI